MFSEEKCTPLSCAAEWHQTEMVRFLSNLGCKANSKDKWSCTPVHVAALQGWSDLVEVLVNDLGMKVQALDIAF